MERDKPCQPTRLADECLREAIEGVRSPAGAVEVDLFEEFKRVLKGFGT